MLTSSRRRATLCGLSTGVLVGLSTAGLSAPAAAGLDAHLTACGRR